MAPTRTLRGLVVAIGTLAALAASPFAAATPVIAVPPGIDAKTITFAPFDGTTAAAPLPSGGVDIGFDEVGETVMLFADAAGGGASSDPVILGTVDQTFGANGTRPGSGAYAGLNASEGSLRILFGRGMNFVGGLLNFRPEDGDASISALAQDGSVIFDVSFESLSLSFTTGAEFHGFYRPAGDIWGLQLSSFNIAVDNLVFGTTAGVPEPQAATLVLAALAALGWQRRRARAARR